MGKLNPRRIMNFSRLATLAALLGLISCGGGGGGGGSDVTDFTGEWKLDLARVRDNCGLTNSTIGPVFDSTYLVNQNVTEVVAENVASGATFAGTVTGDDSFSVRSPNTELCSGGFTVFDLIFDNVSGDRAETVTFESTLICPFLGRCEILYTGSAERR